MSDRFGNYEFIEKIAVGGMAEIYTATATHGKGVEKLVCIKRIHPALSADKAFVAMFIDEARLGVSLVHSNIVPVFDFGYVDGHYFLAMEYVDGNDLAALRGRAKVVEMDWPPELAVLVVMEILEGLSYAHNKRDNNGHPMGLIHRDVSPSNILLSNDGQVKLLDFGIARSHAREFETRTGVIKGKPGYMSPEQATGSAVDARADVWSCGTVLHELITGVRLKEGREKADDPLLEEVLDRSLAPDPDNRYKSAVEMQRALADVLVARSWRPYARDLAEFIERVRTAQAPGEDWDMKSSGVEQHVADALKSTRAEARQEDRQGMSGRDSDFESGKTLTAQLTPSESSEEVEQLTALVTSNEDIAARKNKVRIFTLAAVLAVAAVVLAYAFFPRERPSEVSNEGVEISESDTGGKAETPVVPTLKVTSEPEGAEIWIDGSNTGQKTPEQIELASGPHEIEVRLSGYLSWRASMTADDIRSGPLFVKLKKGASTVSIKTVPEGAQVLIDKREIGLSPATVTDLQPGLHTVSARLAGYVTDKKEINVQEGGATDVVLELKARVSKPIVSQKKSMLNVNTVPWSQVQLDGKQIGPTPIRGFVLSPGHHKVVMTNPVSNISKTLTFNIKPGEDKKISERLAN